MSKKSVKRAFICIQCPVGCNILVSDVNSKYKVTGNECPRGSEYAMQEISNPTRILTTTVKVKRGKQPLASVRSLQDIPKHMIIKCVKELSNVIVDAPVACGEVIYHDICGTGVDIICTRTVEEIK